MPSWTIPTTRKTTATGGADVWGSIPKPVIPPNPLADMRTAVPNFDQLTSLLSGNLMSGLQGMIAPDVSRAVIDAANSRAIAGGFGGSGFQRNLEARDLGLTSKQIQDQAFAQALPFFQTQSKVATLDPQIQAGISQYNSILAAMPDPVKRAEFIAQQQRDAEKRANFVPKFGGGNSVNGIPVGGGGSLGPVSPGSLDFTRWMNNMGSSPFPQTTFTPPAATSGAASRSFMPPEIQGTPGINRGPNYTTPFDDNPFVTGSPSMSFNLFENPNGGSNIQNILRSALGETPTSSEFAADPYSMLTPF